MILQEEAMTWTYSQ